MIMYITKINYQGERNGPKLYPKLVIINEKEENVDVSQMW